VTDISMRDPHHAHLAPAHGSLGHGVVAHQFDDAVQQHEAATLGMWAFLATEVLFFGALFAAYAVYRHFYFPAFRYASEEYLRWYLGGINTGVLLCSSLTVALAVHAAHDANNKLLLRLLLLTMLLGVAFLAIKAGEYYIDYREGVIPGGAFFHPEIAHDKAQELIRERLFAEPHLSADEALAKVKSNVRLFMTFYFIMTGIHATHMLVGLGLFTWLAWHAHRGRFSPQQYNAVEICGLYWHFVDLVWIFLFPMLYLIR
jgi:cytochrome c oxidase subunit 3